MAQTIKGLQISKKDKKEYYENYVKRMKRLGKKPTIALKDFDWSATGGANVRAYNKEDAQKLKIQKQSAGGATPSRNKTTTANMLRRLKSKGSKSLKW